MNHQNITFSLFNVKISIEIFLMGLVGAMVEIITSNTTPKASNLLELTA